MSESVFLFVSGFLTCLAFVLVFTLGRDFERSSFQKEKREAE